MHLVDLAQIADNPNGITGFPKIGVIYLIPRPLRHGAIYPSFTQGNSSASSRSCGSFMRVNIP